MYLPDSAGDTVVAVRGEVYISPALFTNCEHGGCLDPIDEEPNTNIDSEFDKKANSGPCVDTPLLEKGMNSLTKGGIENVAGIIYNILSPRS